MPGGDQGVLLMMLQTPASATAERTDVVVDRFQKVIREAEKKDVEHVFTVRGYSFAGTGQNNSMGFIKLKDWSERKDESSSANAVMMRSLGTLFHRPLRTRRVCVPVACRSGTGRGRRL